MAIFTNGQHFRVAGRYALVARAGEAQDVSVSDFPDLPALAREVGRLLRWQYGCWDQPSIEQIVCAVTPNGKLLDLLSLSSFGRRLTAQDRNANSFPGYVRRSGPVEGIRARRGGSRYSRRYYRQMSTTPERRAGELVLLDEGEVAPRAKRNPSNVPNSWDDRHRSLERGWKSQHKGRKVWDRLQTAPKMRGESSVGVD